MRSPAGAPPRAPVEVELVNDGSRSRRRRPKGSAAPRRPRGWARRAQWVGVVALVALVAGGLVLRQARRPGSASWPAPSPPPRPVVTGGAFAGQGELAFVSGGQLYLLSGQGRAHRLAGSGRASGPAWSPDGRWLAFLRSAGGGSARRGRGAGGGSNGRKPARTPAAGGTGAQTSGGRATGLRTSPGAGEQTLWVARASGAGLHPVGGLVVTSFSWSPASDTLALVGARASSSGRRSWGVWLAGPRGPARWLAAPAGGAATVTWSADGRFLALAGQGGGVEVYRVAQGRPSGPPVTLTTAVASILSWSPIEDRLAAVTTGRGGEEVEVTPVISGRETPPLIPWAPVSGAADQLEWSPDGMTLAWVAGPVAAPALHVQTVARRQPLTWPLAPASLGSAGVAWSPDSDAVAFAGRGGRGWVCGTAGSCSPVKASGGASLEDPTWSPDGSQLAWVGTGPPGGTACGREPPRAGSTLWVGGAQGGAARCLPGAGFGASAPAWSASGDELAFLQGGMLWLMAPTGRAQAQLVVGPVAAGSGPAAAWPGSGANLAWFRW